MEGGRGEGAGGRGGAGCGGSVGGGRGQGQGAVRVSGEPGPQRCGWAGLRIYVQAGEGERELDGGVGWGVQCGGVEGGVEQGGVDVVPGGVYVRGEGGFGVEVAVVVPGGGQALEGGPVVEPGVGELVIEPVQAGWLGAGWGPGAGGPVPVLVVVVVWGGGGGAGGVAGPGWVLGGVWGGGLGVDGDGAVAVGCGGSGG